MNISIDDIELGDIIQVIVWEHEIIWMRATFFDGAHWEARDTDAGDIFRVVTDLNLVSRFDIDELISL